MINFFRNIRQRLITEGKFINYLKYAIGEIILVVIGILIALQVNNWNEQNKQRSEAKQFSERLINEIRVNISILDKEISKCQKQSDNIKIVLHFIGSGSKKPKIVQLDSLMFNFLISVNAKFSLGTLKEGLSNGKISIVHSDSLRTLLYDLESRFNEVSQREIRNNNEFTNNFIPYLFNHYSIRNIDGAFSPYKKDIGKSSLFDGSQIDILYDKGFENRLDNRFYNMNNLIVNYKELRNHLGVTINMLHKEIGQ